MNVTKYDYLGVEVVKYSDYEKLEEEVEHLREYTDHLVAFSKLPCLPKDLENLRETNGILSQENHELRLKLHASEVRRKWDNEGWKNKFNSTLLNLLPLLKIS